MKKLFTLLALLACFMGAKAAELIDKQVDFSKLTDISEVQWYSWGGSGREKFDISDGCLHFSQEERTTDDWGVQVFPLGGIDCEEGVTYYLEVKIKGTGFQTNKDGENIGSAIHNINLQLPNNVNHDRYNCIDVTEDFQIATVVYECTANGQGNLLFQCGSWVGDLWIEYMKFYHEGKEPAVRVWENILTNGDAEGEYGDVPCAYSKEYGENNNDPHAAPIIDLDGNKVFLSHHNPVDPPLVWDSDGEQWGQQHSAGDPMPDNAWQNQFWISLPEAVSEGEQLKVSFKYKASVNGVKADIQTHAAPGSYIGGFTPGSITFSDSEWGTFEQEFSAPGGSFQSIAFNLGVGDQYTQDIEFYFDELEISKLKLEEGFFVAYFDTDDKEPAYDYDNAIKFEEAGDGLLSATVGTVGDEDSWVNEVTISTKRGDDKAFKAAALTVENDVTNDPDDWNPWSPSNGAKITLPRKGVWKILLDSGEESGEKVMSFEKLEGEPDLPPLEPIENTTEVTLNGLAKVSAEWDNQFWISANRALKKGEKVYIHFEYKASEDGVTVATQGHNKNADGNPINYKMHGLLPEGDMTFNEEWQTYDNVITIPDNADGIWSLCFNMAYPDHAVDYTIKNVIWMNAAKTERLVDPEATDIFWLKVGDGTPVQYPAVPLPAAKKGDVNGDNVVDALDLQDIISQIVIGEFDAAKDVNGDGVVDALDIQDTISIIVGQ